MKRVSAICIAGVCFLAIAGTAAAAPKVSVDDVTVAENAGDAVFTVALSKKPRKDASVRFDTFDASAFAPFDYVSVSKKVRFKADGKRRAKVRVEILDDVAPEATEAFSVELSSPNNAALFDGHAQGFITDND